jgi:hypothetical protein
LNCIEAVTAWRASLEPLPFHHPRRWGDRLLVLGCIAQLLAMFATPPWASLGVGVALAGALLSRAPLRRMPWLWLGLAYGGWLSLSCLIAWAMGVDGARIRLPGPTWTWMATPLVALGLAAADARRKAWIAITMMAVIAMVLAAIQFSVGLGGGPLKIDPDGRRWQLARGFSEHHLTFGLACALLLTASIQLRTAYGVNALTAWLARIAAIIGLLVSGSRAAVLGAGAGLWATFSARGRRWALIGLGLALLGGGAVAARFATTDPHRFASMLALQDGRWPIWRTSLFLACEHPVLGCGGKDAFKAAYRDAFPEVLPDEPSEFADGAPHAHNAALSLVAEYGLPALLLHLAFWGFTLVWLWRRRHDSPDAWRLGLGVAVVALVGGMFEPYPTRAVQSIAIHAALGLAVALAMMPSARQRDELAN